MARVGWGTGVGRSFTTCIAALLLAFPAMRAFAGGATLTWDAVASPVLAGYMLHYGPSAGNYPSRLDVGNVTTRTVSNLTEGATYHFVVTAYDASHAESAFSNDVSFTIPPAAPIANFTASTTSGVAPLALNFISTSTGSITGYQWTFGDGTSSTAAAPSHVYVSAGTYTVGLTVTGPGGTSTKTAAGLVRVTTPGGSTDVALAANGAVVTASSTYGAGYSAAGANDGRRSGAGWGSFGGWNDATHGTFPDWLQVRFNGTKTIDHVVVYSVQDNYQNPVEPTDTMTFTRYGLTSFDVQAWNGTAWITLAGVRGNNLVKRTVSFPAYAADRIRIYVLGSADGVWSRITEVEAWSSTATPLPQIDVALASNGATAIASSTYSAGYSPAGTIDGRRSGAGWGVSGGWNDSTYRTFPDWLQINFNATRTIDHVVVYSVQDHYQNPIEPTGTMTFSLYGLTAFQVQGWNGSGWVTLGSVTGNNLVKRTLSFASYTTDRIRILITGAADGVWSRIAEIEAWGR